MQEGNCRAVQAKRTIRIWLKGCSVKIGLVDLSQFVGGAERELLDNAAAIRDDYGASVLAVIDSRNTDFASLLDRQGIPFVAAVFDLKRNRGVSSLSLSNLRRIFGQARTLRKLQRDHALDLLVTYSFHSGIIGAIARLLGLKAKLVIAHVVRRDLTRGGLMEHLQFFAADAVTYNSNSMRLSFQDVARRYSRPEKVVYSYVKKPVLQGKHSARGQLIAQLGLSADTKIVGYFGHVFPYKRVADVVEAVALLNKAAPDKFFLVAVGASSAPADYETHVRALAESKCPDRHHFFTFVDDPFPLLAACDVLVLPSIEPFGRVLVEAMYLGVPFVATNEGGPKEIMEHADPRCGKLVAPMRPDLIADAIVAVTKHRPGGHPAAPYELSREAIISGAFQFYQQVLTGNHQARGHDRETTSPRGERTYSGADKASQLEVPS